MGRTALAPWSPTLLVRDSGQRPLRLPWGFEPRDSGALCCELRSSHLAWRFQDGGFGSVDCPRQWEIREPGLHVPAIRSSPLSFKRPRAEKARVVFFFFKLPSIKTIKEVQLIKLDGHTAHFQLAREGRKERGSPPPDILPHPLLSSRGLTTAPSLPPTIPQ